MLRGDACVGLDKIKNMLLRAYIIIKKENSYACLSILHALVKSITGVFPNLKCSFYVVL